MNSPEDINKFARLLQSYLIFSHLQAGYTEEFMPLVSVRHGDKRAKLIRTSGPQVSAYAWVEYETGNIFKSASWNAPAKGARGNINNHNPLQGCTPYGIQHLK